MNSVLDLKQRSQYISVVLATVAKKSFNISTTLSVALLILLLIYAQAVVAATSVYPPSPEIATLTFDTATKRTLANGSDNWAITWAEDGHQYTTWGDGGGFGGTGTTGRVSLGYGRVEGGVNSTTAASFEGKSLGVLSVAGSLYTWRNGSASETGAFEKSLLYTSNNHFVTLNSTSVGFVNASDFPSSKGFFSPTFLQFGQDYSGARDNYVYVYAPENKSSVWEVQKPGEITLMRVLKTELTQAGSYEFFSGLNGTTPTWTSSISARQPVFRDAVNGVMRTSVSYNPVLKRYFLITQQVSRFKDQGAQIGVYDAPEPWGPWTTVMLTNPWSANLIASSSLKTVYWNFSNKWLSTDGMRFVLVYTDDDRWATMEGNFVLKTNLAIPTVPTGGSATVTTIP
jgi:hypothetical protein